MQRRYKKLFKLYCGVTAVGAFIFFFTCTQFIDSGPWVMIPPLYIYAIVGMLLMVAIAFYCGKTASNIKNIADAGPRTEDEIKQLMYSSCFYEYLCYRKETSGGLFRDKKEKGYERLPQEIKARIAQMKTANGRIADIAISAKIDELEEILTAILKSLAMQPEKEASIKTMVNYYLPTTIDLLNAYASLDDISITSEEITEAKTKIAHSLNDIVEGFNSIFVNMNIYSSVELIAQVETLISKMSADGLLNSNSIRD